MQLFHHLVLYNEHNEVQYYSMQTLNLLKIHETMRKERKIDRHVYFQRMS
jgi:hypothetical protein